jgi:DNA replication protein DnaC
MVISTNLTVEEIRRRYSPQIASRLEGSFNRLTFVGEDIRVLKNRGY